MTGRELLDEVFGNAPTTMLSLLTSKVSKYNRFGSAGVYNYLWIVYFKVSDGVWRYRDESNRSHTISRDKAEEKAIAVRDSLIFCVDAIEQYGTFQSIADYQELQNTLKKVFFFDYNWVLKYYQMLYSQFFPGMYGEDTLDRALHILGLPNHKGDKFIAAGEISLFIRRCKVHNIIFNEVYSAEWGWDVPKPPCENAAANYSNRLKPIAETNDADYSLKIGTEAKIIERVERAEEIEKELSTHQLEGKEKEAVVKVRVNQGEFRGRLLLKYDKCCLCGVSNPALLVASHIKPWSVCEPEERIDENNGFLLCPNHDKLFDSGLISFEDTGEIIISNELSEFDKLFMNIKPSMRIKNLNVDQRKFLIYHRINVFRGG